MVRTNNARTLTPNMRLTLQPSKYQYLLVKWRKQGAGLGSVVVAVSFLFFSYTPNNKNVVIEK